MREEVRKLSELGPLPNQEADAELIDLHGDLLDAIEKPVTNAEAKVLVRLFGPDDCYGLAWSLIHLIESAPGWPIQECLEDEDNFWIRMLVQRLEYAKKLRNSE